jgi:hypothetical protein
MTVRPHLRAALGLISSSGWGVVSAFAAPFPDGWEPFAAAHCVDCHDDSVQKGGLNLADLPFDPADATNAAVWQRVHERVRSGEMPPDPEPRPPAGPARAVLAALEAPLRQADRADILALGRTRGRRLTRTEYEQAVHDLLGIDLPLRDGLPEDPAVHGFSTVAEGQQLSHHQLASYLETADRALEEAMRRIIRGDAAYRKTHSPEDLAKRGSGNYRGPDLRDGKSLSWPIGLQFFGRMPVTKVPADGWYRVTLRDVEAVNPGPGGVVWGTLRSGECSSAAPMLYPVGLVEATAEPRDLEFEAWIREDHLLELRPNDAELKRAPNGATGGNVSFQGRDLAAEGYAGIAHRGIRVERIHPLGDRRVVRERVFGDADPQASGPAAEAALAERLAHLGRRAFRRPVDEASLAPYLALGTAELAAGGTLTDALRAALRAMLCSPRFLTFVEAPGPLDDHALAARLAFALWGGLPDAELDRLADAGKLRHGETLDRQVDRMLADAKAERFVRSFTDQWLKLKEIDFTSPDTKLYPTFDAVVQDSLLLETRAYVSHLLREDLPVRHLVDADFSFWNERLVRHYQSALRVTPGQGLQRVSWSGREAGDMDRVRGGLLAQGAVLKVTADGTRTSPVVRGVFANERILGLPVPPPPPGVPAIEPDIRGATSVRDLLEKHRSNASCASCHAKIDPPGFALESFDPVGRWRVRYGKSKDAAKVDASGITPDGQAFAGFAAWKRLYAEHPDLLAAGFVRQFLTYATGAPVRFGDEPAVEAAVARAAASRHGLRSLIREAVRSEPFGVK